MFAATPHALVFAGLPPPVGGVASIVQMLYVGLAGRSDVVFAAPLPKSGGGLAAGLRALRNLWGLVRGTLRIARGGRVLMFSSAGFSFYEKLLWSLCVTALGRKPVLAMVDGNFPAFWQRQRPQLQALARRRLACPTVRLGVQSPSWAGYYSGIFPQSDVAGFAATVAPEFWQEPAQVAQDPLRVLYVGWMIEEKGIADLLDAFALVLQQAPAARLRLVGPLFDQQEFWAWELARRQLAGNVDMVGPITDRAALIRELRSAALFVLPSHAEGLPVALLEAMALGMACVATDVGAVVDVLDHGRAGILVPVRAPQALAVAIARLLADPPARAQLAAAAQARVRAQYGPGAFIASYLRLLDLL
jgi:glycosyltransferase involved in cell wall biosynthesis